MTIFQKVFKVLKGDIGIWIVVFSLAMLSIVEVYSVTSTLSYRYQDGNTFYYPLKHLFFIVLGVGMMFVSSHLSYKRYYKVADILLWISVFLLFVTLAFGTSTNDARRWFTIPLLGISFQTSDLAKLTLMLFVAKMLSRAQNVPEERHACYVKCIIGVAAVCILVLPANFSTAFLIGFSSLVMLVLGRFPRKWLWTLLGVAVVFFAIYVVVVQLSGSHSRVGTWASRIESFFSSDDSGNFQVSQSKAAIAHGGLVGAGIGGSIQRNTLPHPYSDFIFAEIIEEGGLIIGLVVIVAYLFLFYRCIKIAQHVDRLFPMFLLLGLSFNIMLQAVSNMLVAVNIMPVTGQPLPFVSMGGTSLLFNFWSVGIILNISRYTGERENVEEIEENDDVEEIVDYPFLAG